MAHIRTRVPFQVGPDSALPADIISFDGLSDGKEHIALVFNQADSTQDAPLVRLHSECLTGDVFHSSRCDCGEQLDEAILRMSENGGVLLYLRQEGRGIGLYNKIDAYALQISGMDTYAANNELGFDDDMRDFTAAAEMLNALNISAIRLLTNNPRKPKQLTELGIAVKEVLGTGVYLKQDNDSYLKAKASRGNHRLTIEPSES